MKYFHTLLFLCLLTATQAWAEDVAISLDFNSDLNNNITATYNSSTGEYTIRTTGTDPYIYTQGLSKALTGNSHVLTFEYTTTRALDNSNLMQIFFGYPSTEEHSNNYACMPQATTKWTEASIDISDPCNAWGWGSQNDVLRLDLGRRSGTTIKLRNLRITSTYVYPSYDFETDMRIRNNGAFLVFGVNSDYHAQCQWGFDVTGDHPVLTRDVTQGSNTVSTSTTLSELNSSDLIGQWKRVKISVNNGNIDTYIDDRLVDSYDATSQSIFWGDIAFRVTNANGVTQRCYFDNVKLIHNINNSSKIVAVDEDFEAPTSPYFDMQNVTRLTDGNRVLYLRRTSTVSQLFRVQPDPDTRTFAIDTKYDTWVCDDELGRTVASSDSKAKTTIDNSQFGMFYYVWHGQHGDEVKDITKLLQANPDNPQWGNLYQFHWAGEPALGYYTGGANYVIARHIQWLVDAGIDYIYLDVTNAFTYDDQVRAIMREFDRRDQLGLKWPKLAFMTHTSSANVVQELYNKWYSKPQYDKYWYTWESKPLILADNSDWPTIPRDIRSHFTVRYSWTWDTGENKWPWVANYPQEPGYVIHNGQYYNEQIIVSTSQHPWSKIGKSYHNGAEPAFDKYGLCKETPQGLYFAEQWTQAFKLHPVMVNITQWNEWMAQRFTINSTSQYDMVRPVATAKFGETYFVDVYNQEFARDIEPSNEPLIRDHYYLQMVDNIRRYRGVHPIPVPTLSKKIDINGNFDQWDNVDPEFVDEPGDTQYKAPSDPATRTANDIVLTKVTKDADNLYFYAKCSEDISLPENSSGYYWMSVLLNADCDYTTGWAGYDYRIVNSGTTMRIEAYNAGSKAWTVVGSATYRVDKNRLMIAVPKSLVGMSRAEVDFDFKWVDNIRQSCVEPLDFYRYGEVAPEARFNYRYKGSQLESTGINAIAENVAKPRFVAEGNGNKAVFSFTVPVGGNVSIVVYDSMGCQAATISGNMAAGRQRVTQALAQGIYVVKYDIVGYRGSCKFINVSK